MGAASTTGTRRRAYRLQGCYSQSGSELRNCFGAAWKPADHVAGPQDYHLRWPKDHPAGWRYVLNTSEDWIKNVEDWPANRKKRKQRSEGNDAEENEGLGQRQQASRGEYEWKRESSIESNSKHHDAYAAREREDAQDDQDSADNEYERLLKKYSIREIALLRSLQHEKGCIVALEQNNGKRSSPATDYQHLISIDEADQFSPDNWIPRSSTLIRLTGKHPLNAEAKLSSLFNAGLITPNEYHYVRNHG